MGAAQNACGGVAGWAAHSSRSDQLSCSIIDGTKLLVVVIAVGRRVSHKADTVATKIMLGEFFIFLVVSRFSCVVFSFLSEPARKK